MTTKQQSEVQKALVDSRAEIYAAITKYMKAAYAMNFGDDNISSELNDVLYELGLPICTYVMEEHRND